MIELPEATNLARQMNQTISGRSIVSVVAGHTPHKLAWYYGDRQQYSALLIGRTIESAGAFGGLVEIKAGNTSVLLGEDLRLRFHDKNEQRPSRHQLLIEFEDQSALSASVQMYGGTGAFAEGQLDNPYYKAAKAKPSPLSPEFDRTFFEEMISADTSRLSLKALLATEQRIPGLGNGVLQDILFNARMHPRKKVNTLSGSDKEVLFDSVKGTLLAMVSEGGRDTEFDLFGHPGGYKTILSKNTLNKPCPSCGGIIKKEAYMGGTVYYCGRCQAS